MRFALFLLSCLTLLSLPLRAEPTTLLALGDSLTAGLGLDQPQSFPAQLETALKAKGYNVVVINAGVSGDTAAQGEARLDWALTDDIDAVLVELGANDALRGLPPAQAEEALNSILTKLSARKLPVLLLGMKAPPNLGPEYVAAFDGLFPRLAAQHKTLLYPFFLDGVAADPKLNQADGIHPNAEGVALIVSRVLPFAEQLLQQVKK